MNEAHVMKRIHAGERLNKIEMAEATLMKRRLEQQLALLTSAIATAAGGGR